MYFFIFLRNQNEIYSDHRTIPTQDMLKRIDKNLQQK